MEQQTLQKNQTELIRKEVVLCGLKEEGGTKNTSTHKWEEIKTSRNLASGPNPERNRKKKPQNSRIENLHASKMNDHSRVCWRLVRRGKEVKKEDKEENKPETGA